jgi:transcriptional regulator with XRE-family HTH domain
MNIGKKIQHRRIELGLTQQELAKKLGYKTKGAICRIEANERSITASQIIEFAKVLGTNPSYFTEREEKVSLSSPESIFSEASLGDRIKFFRKEKNLTQSELAQELNEKYGLNIDRAMISKWESGYQVPVISTLKAITDFFDVTLDFLTGIETPFEMQKRKNEPVNDLKPTPAICNILCILRKQRNMTQAELAQKLGVGNSTISMYENGLRIPDYETEELLAKIFNVTIDELHGKTASDSDICNNTATLSKSIKIETLLKLLPDIADLTEENVAKVSAFIQGLKANR